MIGTARAGAGGGNGDATGRESGQRHGQPYDRQADSEADRQAGWCAAIAAIDLAIAAPERLGGLVLHGRHGPVRDALLASIAARRSVRRLDANAADGAFEPALDLGATIAAGRAVRHATTLERLGAEDLLLVAGAERLSALATDRLVRWMDGRPGVPVVALDESLDEDDASLVDGPLGERLALHVRVPEFSLADLETVQRPGECRAERSAGAATPHDAPLPDTLLSDLVRLAEALGVASARATIGAVATACAAARLAGRDTVTMEDAALAARLVLAPRATRSPLEPGADDAPEDTAAPDETAEPPPADPDERPDDGAIDIMASEAAPPESLPESAREPADRDSPPADDRDVERLPDRLVEAVCAALPPNLLGSLATGFARGRGGARARAGSAASKASRGRPVGVGRPRASDGSRRLNLVATLKAAVPWQRIRTAPPGCRLAVRPSDFRVRRYVQPDRTTTVFVVDASGSSAMHRIGEAKGALEAVLAECYVRRDRVALISFRGTGATLELPPTRSLARARRALVGLPAGGGTPIASGLDLAARVLGDIVRGGENAVGILMTDGRANVGRDGIGGRHAAQADAEQAAGRLSTVGARLLYVDTAPRPRPVSARLAETMGARYLPLPNRAGAALPSILAGVDAA